MLTTAAASWTGASFEPLLVRPVPGTREQARLPLALLAVLLLVWVATGIAPPSGHLDWTLEIGPGVLGVIALGVTFRRFAMTRLVYWATFVHCLVLTYGGYYTYAKTPLGEWARTTFHLARNHYDRIGHICLGLLPAFAIREVLLRVTPLRRGGWLGFLVVSVVLASAAFYEFIEWWAALLLDAQSSDAFLGTQGDVWDTQWDMFLGFVGGLLNTLLLTGLHDRALRQLFERGEGPDEAK